VTLTSGSDKHVAADNGEASQLLNNPVLFDNK
jgi:hypothetical protein